MHVCIACTTASENALELLTSFNLIKVFCKYNKERNDTFQQHVYIHIRYEYIDLDMYQTNMYTFFSHFF